MPIDDMKKTMTLFDKLERMGYENHIVWSKNYQKTTLPFSNCYGSGKTFFHKLNLNQVVGPHFAKITSIQRSDRLAIQTINSVFQTIDNIVKKNMKIFLWIHLPHVLLGRTSYGDDIDLFDDIVGHLRMRFDDECIFITADHGNMNGTKGKYGYGFDVYEPAIRIPFITPRLENLTEVDFPTSNRKLQDILIERIIPKDDYVLSDCAYFAQPHRKLAIIKDKYKYIYSKSSYSEELYDLYYDETENINLLGKRCFDSDRKVTYNKKEVYFYPDWDEVDDVYFEMVSIKDNIWQNGTFSEEIFFKVKRMLSIPYNYFRSMKRRRARS